MTESFKMNVQDELFLHLLQIQFHFENYFAEGNDKNDDELRLQHCANNRRDFRSMQYVGAIMIKWIPFRPMLLRQYLTFAATYIFLS